MEGRKKTTISSTSEETDKERERVIDTVQQVQKERERERVMQVLLQIQRYHVHGQLYMKHTRKM